MTIAVSGGPLAVLVQFQGYRSAAGSITYRLGHGSRSHGTLTLEGAPTEATITFYYSDVGYRSSPSDPSGVIPYEPYLMESFALDRRLNLDPTRTWVSVGWGQIRIRLTPEVAAILPDYNSDGRDVSVYMVRKVWDPVRLYWTDPAFSQADLVFKGLAGPWRINDYDLIVPVRDPSYWLEKPVQQNTFDGSGTYGGTASLKGKPKPRTRGGDSSNPVREVKPTLIDPVNLIYQYSDGPGTVVNLYEGGYAGYTFNANTTNLYVGTTPAGNYRTDNSRGLFQLGTSPQREITADVTGDFPVQGAVVYPIDLARYSMLEDMALPAGLIDAAAFSTLNASLTYFAGYWLDTDQTDGSNLLSYILSSAGVWLVPGRDGKLRPKQLKGLTGTETPALILDESQIISMTNLAMPNNLDPPAYRWRVGCRRIHYARTSDLSPLVTDARKQTLSQEMSLETWSSSDVLAKFRRPNDPQPIGGALTGTASPNLSAQAVADNLGSLFSTGAGLYTLTIPVALALSIDLTSVVSITYPIERFRTGRLVQVVGESLRLGDGAATLEVLG